ncbi:MAG TPA: Holliday junction branch migration protein RuvA [Lentisphaeria bacterium]|nr:MAG: Holliday junction DNA helicase RuvA [Lentisphaerae bacterium GWF2_50_93]HCE45068.1 Holliday junction branch migration protein RuvA [Lentisphaeria bacterium]
MIGSLTGILKESSFTEILIDVNGVGYLVFIPLCTFDKLPKVGEKASILVYTNVKEDDIQLYGFATAQEKQLFKLLMTVSGIGPKIALNVLSTMSVSSFCAAVANADLKAINGISGIGKKTAELLVLELKNKVKDISPESSFEKAKVPDALSKSMEDAVRALVQLGFKQENAMKAIHELAAGKDPKECSTENLIRLALRSLNK